MIDEGRSTAVLIGSFDERCVGSLAGLDWQCADHLSNCEFVDDAMALVLIGGLAAKLRPALLGKSVELVPVLRGGLTVASQLVYESAIRDVAFTSGGSRDLRLVVDDVVLSGRRIVESLSRMDATPTIVGLLHSHESIPWRLMDRFPHVEAVAVSAFLPANRVATSSAAEDLVAGLFHSPIYRWNEPECTFRNPVTGEIEVGWKLMPNSACRGNPPVDESEFVVGRVLETPLLETAQGAFLGCAPMASVICRPSESIGLTLRGEAHDLFESLACSNSVAEASERMAELYEGDVSSFEQDLRRMVHELTRAGFLA